MAKAEEYNGPRHAAIPIGADEEPTAAFAQDAVAATDEATGTPPNVSAKTRTTVYVVCLTFNVLSLIVFGLLPIFNVLDSSKANEAMNIIIAGVNLLSTGLAVGYRPTRTGSPVQP